MEEAHKKLRICLFCVVAAAVIIGIIYYISENYGKMSISEGTLVMAESWEM